MFLTSLNDLAKNGFNYIFEVQFLIKPPSGN